MIPEVLTIISLILCYLLGYKKTAIPIGLAYFIIYWLPKFLFVKGLNKYCPYVVTHNNNNNKKIYLTFDDAPYGYTKKIINLLNKHNMKASFFVIADKITDKNKKILIKAIQDGHQLCNHGKQDKMHVLLKKHKLADEIVSCNNKIIELYQEANKELPKNKYYRPGCGFFGKTIINYTKKYYYKITLGSVYPNDPVYCIPYWNYLYLKWHIESGDIIILHDRYWTPKTLEYLLPWLKENGYTSDILDNI